MSFGIIGCGAAAEGHAEALTNIEEAKLVAVADIDERRGREFADKHQASFFRNYHDLLALKELEAVNICTPNYLHTPIGVHAAKAGKHVFVEKPLATTLEQADELISICQQAKVKLAVVFQTRFSPGLQKVKRFFKRKGMGRIVLASFSIKTYRPSEYFQGWHKKTDLQGGGVAIQQGIHGIDRLQWLVGRVDSVFAFQKTIIGNLEGEDTIVAALRFNNGTLGTIEGSTSVYCKQSDLAYTERMEFHGENRSIALVGANIVEWYTKEPQGPVSLNISTERIQGLQSQVRNFIRAIGKNKEPLVNGEEARKSLELVTALYRSAETEELVRLPLS